MVNSLHQWIIREIFCYGLDNNLDSEIWSMRRSPILLMFSYTLTFEIQTRF